MIRSSFSFEVLEVFSPESSSVDAGACQRLHIAKQASGDTNKQAKHDNRKRCENADYTAVGPCTLTPEGSEFTKYRNVRLSSRDSLSLCVCSELPGSVCCASLRRTASSRIHRTDNDAGCRQWLSDCRQKIFLPGCCVSPEGERIAQSDTVPRSFSHENGIVEKVFAISLWEIGIARRPIMNQPTLRSFTGLPNFVFERLRHLRLGPNLACEPLRGGLEPLRVQSRWKDIAIRLESIDFGPANLICRGDKAG